MALENLRDDRVILLLVSKMQNHRRFSGPFLLSSFGLVAFAALVVGAVGCSSNAATTDAGAAEDACTALAACCASIGGVGESTCQSLVTAAREANSLSTCAATLQSYTQGGCARRWVRCERTPGVDASIP